MNSKENVFFSKGERITQQRKSQYTTQDENKEVYISVGKMQATCTCRNPVHGPKKYMSASSLFEVDFIVFDNGFPSWFTKAKVLSY